MALNEAYMVRGVDFLCLLVVASVGLSIGVVPYEDTFEGTIIDFGVVLVKNEDKCTTANFA